MRREGGKDVNKRTNSNSCAVFNCQEVRVYSTLAQSRAACILQHVLYSKLFIFISKKIHTQTNRRVHSIGPLPSSESNQQLSTHAEYTEYPFFSGKKRQAFARVCV
jgi:hypothetical protein